MAYSDFTLESACSAFALGVNQEVDLFASVPVAHVSPLLRAVVEAKNDNIKGGLGQCTAEMVAARTFNQRHSEGPSLVHGAVTTGSLWKFLKLSDDTVFIDRSEYYLDQLEKVLGILLHCVGGDPATAGAAA
jgi:hypothetical protein